MPDDPDLKDVIREETSRGRRPIDTDKIQERKRIVRVLRRIWSENNEEKFVRAMRESLHEIGIEVDQTMIDEFVRLWREIPKL